jgi:hypothetical protein
MDVRVTARAGQGDTIQVILVSKNALRSPTKSPTCAWRSVALPDPR